MNLATTDPRAATLLEVRAAMDCGRFLVPPPDFARPAGALAYGDALAEVLAGHDRARGAPLHVYAHVPLCEEHCSFCMYFYSPTDSSGSRAARCARQLLDLLDCLPLERPAPAAAIYVGGGTPSVLGTDDLARLVGTLTQRFAPEALARVTVEMSPRSSSPAMVEAVLGAGANRISFGVQTLDQHVSAGMRRRPTDVAHLRRCLAAAETAGAVDVNVDLLSGVEGQPEGDTMASAMTLARLGVPCITVYRHRPLAGAGLEQRGGAGAYLAAQRAAIGKVVEAIGGLGYETAGELGAESVRLLRSDHLWSQPRLPDRNCYRTQYDPLLGNHLLGLGSGAQSFAGGDLSFGCPHVPDFDGPLAQRTVETRGADETERYALAVVRALHWNRAVGDDELRARFPDRALEAVYGPEFRWLEDAGAVRWTGRAARVCCPPGMWALYEKVLYPQPWLHAALNGVPR